MHFFYPEFLVVPWACTQPRIVVARSLHVRLKGNNNSFFLRQTNTISVRLHKPLGAVRPTLCSIATSTLRFNQEIADMSVLLVEVAYQKLYRLLHVCKDKLQTGSKGWMTRKIQNIKIKQHFDISNYMHSSSDGRGQQCCR